MSQPLINSHEHDSCSEEPIPHGSDKEEEEFFLPKNRGPPSSTKSGRPRSCLLILLVLNCVVLFCSIVTLSVAFTLYRPNKQTERTERNWLLKQTSYFSSILDQVDTPLKPVQVEGDFFAPDHNLSIYRQLPSPYVDAAWDRISTLGQVFLTTEEVVKLGKDPTMMVRDNDHPEMHIGLVNAFHEIHCLNVLRQNLHRDYYWPNGINSPFHWVHVYHCLHLILQSLTCNANTDLVTYNWVETRSEPMWDYAINRVCRDFDALLEWHNRTTRPIDDYNFHRVGGEKERPAPDQLKRIVAHGSDPRVSIKTDPAILGSFDAWY